jgi:hypothetical protein
MAFSRWYLLLIYGLVNIGSSLRTKDETIYSKER